MACETFLTAHFKEGGVFAGYTWHCKGKCDSGAKCEQQSRTRIKGNQEIVDIWCGCGKREPRECHLVLRQTFNKNNPVAVRECVLCVGECPKKNGKHQDCQLEVRPFRISPEILKVPCADINVLREVRFKYECNCSRTEVM